MYYTGLIWHEKRVLEKQEAYPIQGQPGYGILNILYEVTAGDLFVQWIKKAMLRVYPKLTTVRPIHCSNMPSGLPASMVTLHEIDSLTF